MEERQLEQDTVGEEQFKTEEADERQLIAEKLVKRLKIHLKIIQSAVIATVIGVVGLVIFVTVASLTGLRVNNQPAFLTGVLIAGGFAILCAACALVTALSAFVHLKKLKKLGPVGQDGEEEP